MNNPPTWHAGAASVRWTPAGEELWLAGYAARTGPARGVHSDLCASAVALRDGAEGETVVIVSVDLIAVSRELADRAAGMVRERFPGVTRENFVFCATHTHFGPEVRRDKVVFFKIPAEYAGKIEGVAERVAGAMAEAAVGALSDMRPARLFARRGRAGFAQNRRGGGVVDHEVPVLEVRESSQLSVPSSQLGGDGGGKLIAVVFGYACHNTTMDPQDCLYSSDWAGRAKREIEGRHPGCVAVFLTGCGADQNPESRGTRELSDRYGLELAEAVEESLRGGGVEVGKGLRVAMGEAELEMVEVTGESIEAAIGSGDGPRVVKGNYLKERVERGEVLERVYRGPMQVVRLGREVLMVLMSGEAVIDWAHKFKGEFAAVASLVWVAGYCNDMYGYVPTLRVQREGGYEGGRANLWSWLPSSWTESVEERVTETVRGLVERVTRE